MWPCRVGGADRDAVYDGEHGAVRAIPESGKVPHSSSERPVSNPEKGGGNSPGVLKPGEYRSVAIDVTRLFDFSLEGKYLICVRMCVWDGEAFRKAAKSNELEITVDGRLGNPVTERLGRGPKKDEDKEKGKEKAGK